MNLAERRGLRLFVFSAMFFAQGIGWAYMAIRVPAVLNARGASTAATGNVIIATIVPFAFKWLWGPLMDRFTIQRFGRRRTWIVFAQAMMTASAAALLAIDDFVASYNWLLVAIVVHTTFNAMQNVAVDALALDLLPEAERGRANGFMYGSKYAGGVLGSAGLATLGEACGHRAEIVAMVVALGALTAVPLLVVEHAGAPPPRRAAARIIGALARVARLRSVQIAALLMLVHNIAGGMLATQSLRLFTQRLGWDADEYSQLAGGPGLAAGFVGSIAAGFIADRIGHRKLAAVAVGGLCAAWLAFAIGAPLWDSRAFTYPLFVIEPFAQSAMVVGLWSVCMDTTTPKTSTTQFAIYTSLMNMSTIIGARVLAGYATEWWDYQVMYLVAAAIQLAALALVPLVDVGEAKRTIPDDESR